MGGAKRQTDERSALYTGQSLSCVTAGLTVQVKKASCITRDTTKNICFIWSKETFLDSALTFLQLKQHKL